MFLDGFCTDIGSEGRNWSLEDLHTVVALSCCGSKTPCLANDKLGRDIFLPEVHVKEHVVLGDRRTLHHTRNVFGNMGIMGNSRD